MKNINPAFIAMVAFSFFTLTSAGAQQTDEAKKKDGRQFVEEISEEEKKEIIENMEILENLELLIENDIEMIQNLELFLANQ